MPIKKKKISELNEAGDLTGFFTIGYRVINGVKESVKYGLQKIQDLYENLIKAISDAGEATADMQELETTVETNENTRATAESERNASEQARQTAELSRASAESERVNAEDVRSTAESDRVTSENARSAAETSRKSAESIRVSSENARVASETARVEAEAARVAEFATIKQNAETATTDATTAANNAYASAEAADTAKEAATEIAEHPTYIGTDNYVYVWNTVTKSYDRTNIYVKGEAFNISKVYASVSALEADSGNTDIKEGAFVLVNTNDVENPDNARLYVKIKNPDDSYRYQFLVDMSGAVGFTGKTPQFTKGTITTSEAGTDVQLSLSEAGTDPDGNPVVALNLVIPRGNPGVPFKVLGHYDTLEALKAAVRDGTDVEGVYAVGSNEPYEYYAWTRDNRVAEGDSFNNESWEFLPVPEMNVKLTHTFNTIHITDAVHYGAYLFYKKVSPGESYNVMFKITGLSSLNYTLEDIINSPEEITDLTGFGITTMSGRIAPNKLIENDGVYSFELTNTGSGEDTLVFMYVGQPGACDITIELIQEPLTGWINQGRLQGNDGKSAYQVACENGFVGTEAEWLASLKKFDELEVKMGIHTQEGYFYADKGWFQCSTKGAGLYNASTDSRFYSPEARVWESDSSIRVTEGASYQFGNGMTKLSLGVNDAVNIKTKYGDVSMGPMNEEYCHFGTDRSKFYMDKPLHVNGEVYGGNGHNKLFYNAGNASYFYDQCRNVAGRHDALDLTGLDENTYYPCVTYIDQSFVNRFEVLNVLDDTSHPTWATHSGGFSLRLVFETNGAGWGAIPGDFHLLNAACAHCNGSPCGGIFSFGRTNNLVIYLRGGGKYNIYKSVPNYTILYPTGYNNGTDSCGLRNYDEAQNAWARLSLDQPSGLVGFGSVHASGNIAAKGEITANYTSDARLKKDIEDFPEEEASKIIMNTRPVTYAWNDKAFELNPYRSKERECGLIAQELESHLPCAIKPVWDEYKAIDYTRLIAPMLSVMKKQEREIEELKKEVENLRNGLK